jgi:predicted transcriptional regulator
MSTPVLVATADQTLEEVECHFEAVSGLPVVDSSLRCVGVVVKNDRARASHGVSSLFPLSHTQITHTHTHQVANLIRQERSTSFLFTDLLLVTVKDKGIRSDDLSSHHTIF